MIPRMRDVAALANVSIASVSIYLNSPQNVGAKSSKRIAAAIEELGFVRNDGARQLRDGTSRTIAFIAFDVADPFTYTVARGARRRAAESNLRLVLADTEGEVDLESDYLNVFEEQRVRGVLFSTVNHADLSNRARPRVPLVMIDHRPVRIDVPSVSVDNLKGGALAAGHLLEIRRTRLAFVGGPSDIQQIADRIAGARLATEMCRGATLEVMDTILRDAAAGRAAALEILSRPISARPDGVFCVNDTVAVGLMHELNRDPTATVPDRIAVIGYNDSATQHDPSVSMSSVRQPHENFGATAVDLLLARAKESHPLSPAKHVIFEPDLVIRGSTIGPSGVL